MIENESVIVNTFRNRECISLPKENFQEIETKKEHIKDQFHQLKNGFLDKSKVKNLNEFSSQIKSFEDNCLKSLLNKVPQVPKFPSALVQECHECLSVLTAQVSE